MYKFPLSVLSPFFLLSHPLPHSHPPLPHSHPLLPHPLHSLPTSSLLSSLTLFGSTTFTRIASITS